jgi:hypothetical protein
VCVCCVVVWVRVVRGCGCGVLAARGLVRDLFPSSPAHLGPTVWPPTPLGPTRTPAHPSSNPSPNRPHPPTPKQYGPDNFREGKAAARAELRRRLGLADVDVPIVSVVTRLVHQKGIHLIKHAAWRTLERGGQFVLLGSAPDGRVQVGGGEGSRGDWGLAFTSGGA